MTCLDMLKKQYPNNWKAKLIIGCPREFGYTDDDLSPCVEGIDDCESCWDRECTTHFTKQIPVVSATRFKIFSHTQRKVEDMVNIWLMNNPNIDIVDIKYQCNGDLGEYHSICILYKEVNAE